LVGITFIRIFDVQTKTNTMGKPIFETERAKIDFKLRSCIGDLNGLLSDQLEITQREMIESIKNDLKYIQKHLDDI